ncbi:Hypothetical protein POVR2_LOCUS211 [uncultured virus]|nr:Hypothetical protein POVR2_LOCUS211 [uncultured virus]
MRSRLHRFPICTTNTEQDKAACILLHYIHSYTSEVTTEKKLTHLANRRDRIAEQACIRGLLDTVKLGLAYGGCPEGYFSLACKNNNLPAVKYLISQLLNRGRFLNDLIYLAICRCCEDDKSAELCELLLTYTQDASALSIYLSSACHNGNAPVVGVLIHRGEIDQQHFERCLCIEITDRREDVVQALLDRTSNKEEVIEILLRTREEKKGASNKIDAWIGICAVFGLLAASACILPCFRRT